MNKARFTKVRCLVCLTLMLVPVAAHGDGSIAFNGSSSKLQHDLANVLDGSNEITVCVWVNSAASNQGAALLFDDTGSALQLLHSATAHTLTWVAGFAPGSQQWSFPADDGEWHAVSITHDKSSHNNDPDIRVDFVAVTESQSGSGTSGPSNVFDGYSVGSGWNGKIAHMQVFNRLLSEAEQEACLRVPGSVTNGLRLWLPMTHISDIDDASGNGFHGTGTSLKTGSPGPILNPPGTAPGNVFLKEGVTTVTQQVIPRYADLSSHPAGQLKGAGPGSAIQGSLYGPTDGSDPQEIVVTEDYAYPNGIKQWQSGAFGTAVAANVADATASGGVITITTTANHGRSTGQTVTISNVQGFEMRTALL
jgi:concanavalin A-like lectin/glucanase superfamily protein